MPYVNPYPKGVYLDNNATMPLLPSVKEALQAAISEDIANPSSIHKPGQRAKELVFKAKSSLCEWLGTRDSEEWIFLSGATEALNTVLKSFEGKAVAYSSVDHSAVVDSIAKTNWERRFEIKVNKSGQICEKSLFSLEYDLAQVDTCLLNWQLVNNETGISFQLDVLEFLIKKFNRGGKQKLYVLMDAAQALGKLDESFIRRAMHLADYVVVSAHKIGGPAGIGALWMREGLPFQPLIYGGMQEKRRRAGTHNILGIAGFYAAIQDWRKNGTDYRAKMTALRDRAFEKLSQVDGFKVHGDLHGDLEKKNLYQNYLCNTLNFHFEACKDESLLLALDLEGFYVSSGSACNSGSLKPSRVLLEMGLSEEAALSSIRFCVGPQTTEAEVDLFCERLIHRVEHIRKSRSKWEGLLPLMKDVVARVRA